MSELITPRVLGGFRDYLPDAMMARERLMETARRVYRSYGFSPIDTPVLEYSEILLGKGGDESDKQLFRFRDNGDRDVAMRFDLTVPLARFSAMHAGELGLPFKRYHIAPVWRGEKPQKGRYREFVQCDFDTIGTLSNAADIETLMVIYDLLSAIGFTQNGQPQFGIRVNNRLILNGVLEQLGVAEKSVGVLRAIDKLPKVGREAVLAEMVEKVSLTNEQAVQVLDLLSTEADLDQLEKLLAANAKASEGVARLRELLSAAKEAGIPASAVTIDLSIARGLDYYTGTIYETFLTALPTIGSVCSGGRYDNLAGLFTKEQLPGIGASLGLDRLLAAMEELGMIGHATTPAVVFVPQFDESKLGAYMHLARRLRAAGIATEVYPEAKKLGKQLQYADRKGFRLAVIAGSDEFAKGEWQVKDLQSGSKEMIADAVLETRLLEILAAGK
ncbi:Histidine--tRNA ligase [Planctopirus ephydatiae]|uniref:Histidine--tRNA ligase n=1 Tax=Planctopirus ephydatiae TaxID=2528019 RepID=A0A518GJZ4_9PLAN|nr:histidine--tRNA ligase [Planctopirus ephydatiae]QDV28898.1 Histidine--tRNA ligase [Planctopirus ephydatiae]